MRGHVQRVRYRGSDLRVAPCGRKRPLRKRRGVVAVDDIVSHAWVVRLFRKNLLQNFTGLFLVCISLISRQRSCVEGKRVERCCLAILRIAQMHLLHRFLISEGARAMIELVCILIKSLDCRDVAPFTVGLGAHSLCFLHSSPPLLQHRLARVFPEGIPQAHRDAPVAHRTVWVHLSDGSEPLACFFKPEGMQQSDSTLEWLLDSCVTGDRKVHCPYFLGVPGRMLVSFI